MQSRISGESANLIKSLDKDSRYIKFSKLDNSSNFVAVICSSITDEELSTVLTGKCSAWIFDDIDKALRSVRRLNKAVPVYSGVLYSSNVSA